MVTEYPKDGRCPVCGGPVDVEPFDIGNPMFVEVVPGKWSCPRGCDPRTHDRESPMSYDLETP